MRTVWLFNVIYVDGEVSWMSFFLQVFFFASYDVPNRLDFFRENILL